MLRKLVIAAIALSFAFGALVAFHPGIAFADSPLAKLSAGPLQKGSYTTDPLHTSIGFEVVHLGIARIQGRFTKTSGKLQVDPNKLEASTVSFTILTESIDTAVAPRDDHLRSPDFFEVAKYPEIKFSSTKIRRSGKGYIAEGDLTIKATTKRIQIAFKVSGPITDPWGGTRIGVVAEPIKLDRQAYGVAYNDRLPSGVPSVGNEITIRLSLEATLDKPAEASGR